MPQVAKNVMVSNLFHPMRSGESLTDLNTGVRKPEIFEQFVGSSSRGKEEVSNQESPNSSAADRSSYS